MKVDKRRQFYNLQTKPVNIIDIEKFHKIYKVVPMSLKLPVVAECILSQIEKRVAEVDNKDR